MTISGKRSGGGDSIQETDSNGSARQLANLLVEERVVTRAQMDAALARQKSRGGTLLDALIGLGVLTPATLVEFLLSHPGAIRAGLASLEANSDPVSMIDTELALKHQVVPIDRAGDTLLVGAWRPLTSVELDELSRAAKAEVKALLCSREDLESALAFHYGQSPKVDDAQRVRDMGGSLKLSHVAQLIHNVQSLPALPETVTRVNEAMEDPSVSVNEVVEIITMDPPIAAKVLSVANSSAYGFPNQIKDLPLAVSLLGLRETYSVVLSVAVVDFLHKLKDFDYRVFWLESMCCAAAARIVAKASGRRNLPGVFTAGLLHDLGRAVLWEAVPDLCKQLDTNLLGDELVRAEERVIGISHPEAGYELAVHWGLPPEIAASIRYHHRPQDATVGCEHIALVALADAMVQAPGDTLEENADVFVGHEETLESLQLDMEVAEAMLLDYLTLRDVALREAEE